MSVMIRHIDLDIWNLYLRMNGKTKTLKDYIYNYENWRMVEVLRILVKI